MSYGSARRLRVLAMFVVLWALWPVRAAGYGGTSQDTDRSARETRARLTEGFRQILAFFDRHDLSLLTAWREIRALRDPERFEPWLHRILTNACYAEARRRRRWSEGVRLLPVEPVHGSDDYATVDNRDQLERAFRRLTVQQRAVLVFHHYLGLSLPEVAVRIGIPLGTVKSRMHDLIHRLREELKR